jgi:hypothetical protein
LGNVIKEQAAPPLEEVRRYSRDALTDAYPLLAAATEGMLATQHTGEDAFDVSVRLIIGPTLAIATGCWRPERLMAYQA